MRAMEKLVDDGLIRFIGVSNFNVSGLKEAEQALSEHRLTCNQVPYNLSNSQIELDVLPYCSDRQIAVAGYSPFGHGGYFPSQKSTQGQLLSEIAKRHGRTPRQVVLNYLTRNPNMSTIPKARNPEHVKENSGGAAGGWHLTEQDIAAIDRVF